MHNGPTRRRMSFVLVALLSSGLVAIPVPARAMEKGTLGRSIREAARSLSRWTRKKYLRTHEAVKTEWTRVKSSRAIGLARWLLSSPSCSGLNPDQLFAELRQSHKAVIPGRPLTMQGSPDTVFRRVEKLMRDIDVWRVPELQKLHADLSRGGYAPEGDPTIGTLSIPMFGSRFFSFKEGSAGPNDER
jgi:hypothetical protein